jgi:hypothetical protein
VLGIAGALGAVFLLGGYVICGDRDPSASAEPQPQAAVNDRLAGLRPVTSGRVPKLRPARPEKPPALARAPETTPPPPAPSSDPKERMAPLVSLYSNLFEVSGLDPTEMRELRKMLHEAHEWVLKPSPVAGALLGNRPSAKREQALALLQKNLSEAIRPEQVERVIAHSFVLELLSWNEPFFESDARGLVSVRADVMPREAPGATYLPESAE